MQTYNLNAATLLALICCNVFGVTFANDFAYNGAMAGKCTGKHLSPLNIDSVDIVNKTFPPFAMLAFQEEPKIAEIVNTGDTILFQYTYDDEQPVISGGPLKGKFIFQEIYFHWMGNDTFGHEDRTDTVLFPAELHMIFRNAKYHTFYEAKGESNGVAVLAYHYKVRQRGSFLYDKLIEIIEDVARPGAIAKFRSPVKLWDFIVYNVVDYYTYTGTMTMPPCRKDVIWIDFKDPIHISEKQLNHFRKIQAHDMTPMIYSHRPFLPFSNRTVFSAMDSSNSDEEYEDIQSAVPFVDRLVGDAAMWKPVEINILIGTFSSSFMTTWIATTRQTMA
ncbi:carbonic anhydrase 1 isoform X1 [Bactrocera neohumeralis]|uniref:carbonic anhydrase 1 isoform X1 n=1 Tax=Bactrocera neohumeralis TaxID=98809 RepID=UPI00216538C7|nr:carbonic anhydrase 1 isoform X1 [Bactrocera neohumeralis]XP_050333539.1 carbonic anhydrase 1 isoform X1 [Bactrocera neohumeralis]XP_050333540.1 carbonic anhydrase 1 isoform X1 [Bactrocera neohumeralis]XP_050333541.1 carbonic anhydrase 1 isoform X1 [Bactrocera neohumeralis]XP_050333542.1 carbonic anhydrase 1 isoform X1 [Bactrocera neohumeralis]XP_050333543.1 carbonic anhydrase 1 isoform X1 [Bactrocera neohumeralis]XP_050333544.1 carbonic anhydrase 1 isoform X1 [Bactrocera neohumeralis]XP_0